jgi:hypothetical protein
MLFVFNGSQDIAEFVMLELLRNTTRIEGTPRSTRKEKNEKGTQKITAMEVLLVKTLLHSRKLS